MTRIKFMIAFSVLFACCCITNIFSQVNSGIEKSANKYLLKAKEYLDTNNQYAAKEELNKLFKDSTSHPKDVVYAQILMGRCMEREDKMLDAKYYFKMALKSDYIFDFPDSNLIQMAKKEIEIFDFAYKRYRQAEMEDNESRTQMLYQNSENLLISLLNGELSDSERLEPLFLQGIIQLRKKHSTREESLSKAKTIFKEVLKINDNYMPPKPARFKNSELEVYLNLQKYYIPEL